MRRVVVAVHAQHMHKLGARGFLGENHWTTLAHMGGVVDGEVHRIAFGFFIALGVKFVVGPDSGNGIQNFDPSETSGVSPPQKKMGVSKYRHGASF